MFNISILVVALGVIVAAVGAGVAVTLPRRLGHGPDEGGCRPRPRSPQRGRARNQVAIAPRHPPGSGVEHQAGLVAEGQDDHQPARTAAGRSAVIGSQAR